MHCNLLVLQHPQERKKYYGTARILGAAIRNSKRCIGESFETEAISRVLGNRTPYLLYPGEDAKPCQDIELNKDSTLIVLDGTWSQAGKLFSRSPMLKSIPKLSFSRSYLSRYRIRQQPKPMCLSTIEAVAYFLLESSIGSDFSQTAKRAFNASRLLDAFNIMVERQLLYWPSFQPGSY